ncbi:interferon alpha/beta receptor 2-like isoform X2 [Ochotona curzoniae]|uniref:interferon alpha/beta receptor 2-like isoform X2 n=1 Tax=Ochotona curzoniae TaxID=130825 RepID=UPI001B35141A|nr:interferon alpha/beta receptor 2-like isoform X2 [Ochotona curzoniae]
MCLACKPEAIKTIESCTNITSTFCDLTEAWEDFYENYFILVEGFQGAVSVNCSAVFTSLDLYIEPPEFEITDFTDHINVTVKFPSKLPKVLRNNLEDYLRLIISEETGGIVKTHKPGIPKNISGNISYVIEKLIPKSNYCVSVYFEPTLQTNVVKPPPKCTLFPPDQEPESTDSAKIGRIIAVSLVAMVLITTTATLKRAGCICLKSKLPKALRFHDFFTWIFPDLPPSEAMDPVEVICINRKKKVWDYNYDDESDSDNETAPGGNAGGYTMHSLLGRPVTQASASPVASEGSQSPNLGTRESDVEELNSPEAHAEPPTSPRWDFCPLPPECTSERPEGQTTDPFPNGDSCSPVSSGDGTAFNVDLKSVFMRLLDEDPEEAPARLSPLPEDISNPEDHSNPEPSLLMSSTEAITLPNPSTCSECQWPEDTPSEKSGTSDSDSDSDVAAGGGYIRR